MPTSMTTSKAGGEAMPEDSTNPLHFKRSPMIDNVDELYIVTGQSLISCPLSVDPSHGSTRYGTAEFCLSMSLSQGSNQ